MVPEIAARAHTEMMTPLVATALADAGMTLDQVDAVSTTSTGSVNLELRNSGTLAYSKVKAVG